MEAPEGVISDVSRNGDHGGSIGEPSIGSGLDWRGVSYGLGSIVDWSTDVRSDPDPGGSCEPSALRARRRGAWPGEPSWRCGMNGVIYERGDGP
jgi:hypothetical protein